MKVDKKKPKYLILNQMAGPMTWELAEDLAKEFGCVALLTGHPDTLAKSSSDNLQLHTAPVYNRGSFFARAVSWILYCLKAFFWLWQFPKTTPLLVYSNPPILLWVAWVMSILRKHHYAVMVHDIYPDVVINMQGLTEKNLFIKVWRGINRYAYGRANVVITLGEYMAANLENQFDSKKTSSGKVEVVPPWVDTDKICPIVKEKNWFAIKFGQVDKLTIMYSGNMGLGFDIDLIINLASLLKDEPNINFLVIGDGPKRSLLGQKIKELHVQNIMLLPWQKEVDLLYSLATADITLLTSKAGNEGYLIPSKSIYALASGSAIFLVSEEEFELTTWIQERSCGEIFRSGYLNEMSSMIKEYYYNKNLRDVTCNNARLAAEKLFEKTNCIKSIKMALLASI